MSKKIPAFKVIVLAALLLLPLVRPVHAAAEHIRDESGSFQPVITLVEANRRAALEIEMSAKEMREVALEANRRTYLEKPEAPAA